jgi:NAD(P)-dependent dehydrogenase (short-subunit alcohol dehydrogenase family)
MPDHQPRTALVTGAARRIGQAIAMDLAAHGWAVAVHHRDSATDARDTVARIEAQGGRAVALAADLCDEGQAADLVSRAAEALGPLTCLVNNASVFENDTFETASRDSWNLHMQVNLRTPFILIQGLVAQLPAGASGNVVNLIDQRVWNLTPYFTSYTLSKTGLWTLTRTLALALAPKVRVNAIGPGPTSPSARQTEEQFARQWASMPLERRVMPQEIADAVRFILDAPSMTGQMIALDGGQHLGWNQAGAGGAVEE